MLKCLEQLCESRIPRKFTCAHAIMALLRLREEPYLGRYILQELLGLSEASVRSLLNLLKRHELIQVNPRRKGHRLSENGEEFVQWVTKRIIPLDRIHIRDLIPEGYISIGFIVKGASCLVTSGVEQRDDAIRRGALGVITLIVDHTTIRFPNGAQDMADYAAKDLEEIKRAVSAHITHNDVILISWGRKHPETEVGALSAAIKLLSMLLKH